MSLRTRTILIVTAVSLIAIAGVSVTLRIGVASSVHEEQERSAVSAKARAMALSAQFLSNLTVGARAVASRGEIRSVLEGDSSALASIGSTEAFTALGANLIAVVGANGVIVEGRVWDPVDENFFPLPNGVIDHHFGTGGAFAMDVVPPTGASGVVSVPRGPSAFAVWPVLGSDGQPIGLVSLATPFPPPHLPLREIVGGDVSMSALDAIAQGSPEDAVVDRLLADPAPLVETDHPDGPQIQWLVHDVYGEPVALMTVHVDPPAVNQGLQALRLAVLTMLIAGVFAGGAVAFSLGRSVTDPVRRIASQVRSVASTGDTSVRVSSAPGEIGVLADSVNAMLQTLDEARATERSLSERLVSAEEDQRREMAKELHDEIGQALTGLKLMLEAASGNGSGGSGRLEEAQALVTSLMTQVRDLSLQLRPSVLDDLGLVPALTWLIERYEHQTGLRVRFQRRGTQRRLQSTIETALYRIAQEALTNVARHADVSTVSVEIEFTDDLISLQVEDEGKGFSPAAAHAGEHLGLRGIRERAAAVGGILAITAVPGNGTVLTVEIPLRKLNTAP